MIKADEIIRTKRKTLAIQISSDGYVTVRAPLNTSQKRIDEAVLNAQGWLEKQLARLERDRQKNTVFISDGSSLTLFGKAYTIRFTDSVSGIKDSEILLDRNGDISSQFIFLLKKIALPRLTERTAYFSRVTGLNPTSVKVTSAKTRWGSCSAKKSINYSVYLALCPSDVIDYVIVHELCHIKHMDHSPDFWNEVGKYIPDYKTRRKWLKDNRNIMNIAEPPLS